MRIRTPRALLPALCLLLGLSACFAAPEPKPPSSVPESSSQAENPQPEPEPEPKPAPPRGDSDYRPELPDAAGRLAQMKRQNPDTVGWLTVPGSGIDEPVFQTYDNSFYLFNDENGQYRRSGSLFVDYECWLADGDARKFSQNTIIYGHNLGNPLGVRDDPEGERFAKLMKFADPAFADARPYIFLTTDAGVQIYEIFSAAYTDAQMEPVSHIYADYARGAAERLIADMQERSLYRYPVPAAADDRLLTLQCCSHRYGPERQNPYERFIVMARLVPEGWPLYPDAGLEENPAPRGPDFEKYDLDVVSRRIAAMNWQHLTPEQKLSDVRYLLETLKENLPDFERIFGDGDPATLGISDLPDEGEALRGSDAAFYLFLQNWLGDAPAFGGFYLDGNPWTFLETAQEAHERAETERLWGALDALYSDPAVRESYERLAEVYGPIDNFGAIQVQLEAEMNRYQNPGPQDPGRKPLNPFTLGGSGAASMRATRNVRAAILSPGETAYIRVRSFDRRYLEEDRRLLRDFYRQVRGYPNVVFDFTGSPGFSREYFEELIASPGATRTLSAGWLELVRDGADGRGFLDPKAENWRDPVLLSTLPEAGVVFDKWRSVIRTVRPAEDGGALGGRLWFCVDRGSGFAARYAAFFAKSTGLATVVGEETWDSGIGREYAGFRLPNSGLIVRYRADYAMLPGGRQGGVEPDCPAREGLSAVETCLRLAEKKQ